MRDEIRAESFKGDGRFTESIGVFFGEFVHVQRLCPHKDVDPLGICVYAKDEYAVHEIDGEDNKVGFYLSCFVISGLRRY